MAFYAAADIGGTTIKLGVLDGDGRVCAKDTVSNPIRQKGAEAMLEAVASKVSEYRKRYDLAGLALSTAGILDDRGTVVFVGPSFPGYGGMPVAQRLAGMCGLPCTAANDANCAALGEAWIGEGKDASPLVCVTLGTGVGGAVLIEGCPLSGASGFAGEIGCLPFEGDILENRASVRALVRSYAEAKKLPEGEIDGVRVLEKVRAGDSDAMFCLRRQMNALAAGIAALILITDPQVIVIGGGAAASADVLAPILDEELDRLRKISPIPPAPIRFSRLGNDAGMVGALSWFLRKKALDVPYGKR